jgi:hypothetical protein
MDLIKRAWSGIPKMYDMGGKCCHPLRRSNLVGGGMLAPSTFANLCHWIRVYKFAIGFIARVQAFLNCSVMYCSIGKIVVIGIR